MTRAAVVGFLLVGAAVVAGLAGPLDQYAVDHLMPGLYPYVGGDRLAFANGFPAVGWNPNRIVNRVGDWVTLPATPVPATAIFVSVLLIRRRRLRIGRWVIAYALVVAAEIAGKTFVHRAPLHTVAAYGSVHIAKFDSSFPSGEAALATFVAGLVLTAWPRLTVPAAAWAVAVWVVLVAAGTHTPSDVAGGVCLGVAAAAGCRAAGGGLRSRPA